MAGPPRRSSSPVERKASVSSPRDDFAPQAPTQAIHLRCGAPLNTLKRNPSTAASRPSHSYPDANSAGLASCMILPTIVGMRSPRPLMEALEVSGGRRRVASGLPSLRESVQAWLLGPSVAASAGPVAEPTRAWRASPDSGLGLTIWIGSTQRLASPGNSVSSLPLKNNEEEDRLVS